jgi:hypothetical protein
MTTTTFTEPPKSAAALGTPPRESRVPDAGDRLVGLPPLLSVVPQAGPSLFVYLGFGVVLLLLLVPPITLVATLMAVAVVVAAALATLVVVAGAILRAPFLLVRFVRGHPVRRFSLAVPHARELNPRRV